MQWIKKMVLEAHGTKCRMEVNMLIARQPIFNKATEIYGYELLFRANAKSKQYDSTSSVSATATVIAGLFEQGIERIVGRSRAFVNFDYEFLMSESIELIDPRTLVIEVLENVIIDQPLIDRLKELSNKGYKIALDDFEADARYDTVMPIISIIKYDIMLTPLDTIKEEVERALEDSKIILAEKVETREEFEQALEMGFHLFQGYFFSKPVVVGGSNEKKTSKIQYIRIINELKKEEPSFNELTKIIESDVNLAYRVMKIMSNKKEDYNYYVSIKEALLKMGLEQIGRWINLLMLQDVSEDKPIELLKLSLIRTKFGEYISFNSHFRKRKDEISLMCLFSTLDALLDQKMEDALQGLPLSEDVYNALVHGTGSFEPICSLLLAYEQGNLNVVNKLAEKININPDILYKGYLHSIVWASRITAMLKN